MYNHLDSQYCQAIIDIIQFGACIGYTSHRQKILSNNFTSATEDSAILTKDLDDQIANNRVTLVAISWKNFVFFYLDKFLSQIAAGNAFVIWF